MTMQTQTPTPARVMCLPICPCDHCGDAIAPHRGGIVCGKCRRRATAQKRRAHQIQNKKAAKA